MRIEHKLRSTDELFLNYFPQPKREPQNPLTLVEICKKKVINSPGLFPLYLLRECLMDEEVEEIEKGRSRLSRIQWDNFEKTFRFYRHGELILTRRTKDGLRCQRFNLRLFWPIA